MDEVALRDAALEYHRLPTPGKISVSPTKGLTNQHDLSLAYSPGVAYACLAIRDDPREAATLTSRSNLVAVITNGTAVLGLGNIGPLAGKPVMEGKGCLFKKFAGIDVFDIEIDATDPEKIVDIVAALEPTFGGINLEDIKAPECFIVERKLRERMKIPVFHDDQHGTAIIVSRGDPERAQARRQGYHQGEGRRLGRWGGGARLPRPAGHARSEAREHLRLRHQGRRLQGPQGGDGPGEVALRPGDQGTCAGGDHARRRHIPGPVGWRRAETRDDQGHGTRPTDPGAGQPRARDPAGTRARSATRCDPVHGPIRLPQPSQQCAVLPLYFPRCARCRCHHHQRSDEGRGRACHRRSGAGGGLRHRRQRLRRTVVGLRSRLPDPETVRSASHRARGAGGCQSRDGERGRYPSAFQPRCVPRSDGTLRLPLRQQHEAGVRGRQGSAQAHHLRRG